MDSQYPQPQPDTTSPIVLEPTNYPANKNIKKQMIKIFCLILLVASLVIGGYYAQSYMRKNAELSNAAKTFTKFSENLKDKDIATAHSYLSDKYKSTLTVDQLKEGITESPQSELLANGVSYKITEKKKIVINDVDSIRLNIVYSKNNVDTHTLRVLMVKSTNGEWKIDQIQIDEKLN